MVRKFVETIDPFIPVSVQVKRFENHLTEMRKTLRELPFWKVKKRWIMRGVIATYQYELDFILEWAGKQQPIWRKTDV